MTIKINSAFIELFDPLSPDPSIPLLLPYEIPKGGTIFYEDPIGKGLRPLPMRSETDGGMAFGRIIKTGTKIELQGFSLEGMYRER